jgi:hypothetical protein
VVVSSPTSNIIDNPTDPRTNLDMAMKEVAKLLIDNEIPDF